MALRKLEADLSVISKLGNNPGPDNGLSEEQIKAKFDEAANLIKDYLNNHLVPELDTLVDVDALLSDILDKTLSKEDKAANALAVGDAIRNLRAFFERVIHAGDYALESDGCFAYETINANTIRVMGGEGVVQGNLFELNLGGYEDVKLTEGATGLYRNDLIAIRCTKNEGGVLNYALVALTGANTSGNPVDPTYAQGDINADGEVREFPLYRVNFDGTSIATITQLFDVEKPMNQYVRDYVEAYYNSHSKRKVVTATLTASGWSSSAPYTQALTVSGILAEDTPHVSPVYSSTLATALEQKEAWAMVDRGVPAANKITFTCFEDKPTTNIPIQIEVNR